MVSEVKNLLFKSYVSNRSQFVEITQIEGINLYILTQDNSTWCATRLNLRASFVFIIYM